jgi:hypothetical protein
VDNDAGVRNLALRREIEDELERIEEESTRTGKSHTYAALRWGSYHYWLGLPAVLLGAVATFAFFKSDPMIGGGLAALVTALTALQTFLKPSERAANHKGSGDQFGALRNDARVYRKIQMILAADVEAAAALRELSDRRNKLKDTCPPFSDRDKRKAETAIEKGETLYEVDKRG